MLAETHGRAIDSVMLPAETYGRATDSVMLPAETYGMRKGLSTLKGARGGAVG